jgi:hypothetical protein
LVSHMNRLYSLFVSRHPTFLENEGKVSIIAHSLGSVLSFDLLCNLGTTHNGVQYGTLDFDVENFFTLGSPVGLFMTLKGIRLAKSLPPPRGLVYAGKDMKIIQEQDESFSVAGFKGKKIFNMVLLNSHHCFQSSSLIYYYSSILVTQLRIGWSQ